MAISAFQDIKVVERESFINKLYFYLFNQTNDDYNAIVYLQPNNPTAIDSENKKEK